MSLPFNNIFEACFIFRARILHVTDGDTYAIDFDRGMKDWQMDRRVRLHNFDTAEMKSIYPKEREHAQAAKTFIEQYLTPGRIVVVQHAKLAVYNRIQGAVWYDKTPGVWVSVRDEFIAAGGYAKRPKEEYL